MPKVKFTKKDILNATYEIIKQDGINSISARKIAAKFKGSTAPIYANFKTIEELKNEVVQISEQKLKEYLYKNHSGREMYDASIGFIKFARDEKELFRAIFLDASEGFSALFNETMDILLKEKIVLKSFPDITFEMVKAGVEQLWINIFGYATLVFANSSSKEEITDEIIEKKVTEIADNFKEIHRLKSLVIKYNLI